MARAPAGLGALRGRSVGGEVTVDPHGRERPRAGPARASSRLVFIATMYSFGRHPACVGVDGIVSCMGIFLDTGAQLYAIHIPATRTESEGIDAFVRYVQANEPGLDPGTASLYAVMNAEERPGGLELLRTCSQRLGITRWKAVKVRDFLQTPAGRSAAAIICRRAAGGIQLEYKAHFEGLWQKDAPGAVARAGHYFTDSMNDVLGANIGPGAGWIPIDATNSTIEEPGGLWGYCSIL